MYILSFDVQVMDQDNEEHRDYPAAYFPVPNPKGVVKQEYISEEDDEGRISEKQVIS